MRILKVEVNDTIFEKVMAFFNKLPKNEIQLSVEEKREIQTPKKLSSFSLKIKGFKFNRDKANER